jgi:streptogrisin B
MMQAIGTDDYGGTAENFPDYFAGAYVDDAGRLVVQTTSESPAVRSKLEAITQNPKIVLEHAQYSQNYLDEIRELVLDGLTSRSASRADKPMAELLQSIAGFGTPLNTNHLVVDMVGITPEKIQCFQENICSSPAIWFAEGHRFTFGDVESEPSVKNNDSKQLSAIGPAPLYAGDYVSGYSLGFRAKKVVSGVTLYGFVTAGHLNTVGQGMINSAAQHLGTIRVRQFSGSVDAAFVDSTTSQVSVTNNIRGTQQQLSANGTMMPSVGVTVKMSGHTSGVKTGQVVSNNYATYIRGVYFTNLIVIGYRSADGDSGGCVFSNNSAPSLVGISVAAAEDGSALSLCVKAGNILSALGVTNY